MSTLLYSSSVLSFLAIYVSSVFLSTSAGTVPCLEMQNPAAYVAMRMAFSIGYPWLKYEARAEIKASAPPVVSAAVTSVAGKYRAVSAVLR